MRLLIAILSFSVLSTGALAEGLRTGLDDRLENYSRFISRAPVLEDTKPEANYDFEGIVGLSNCSGSLIRFENSSDDDMAMVLTNGHCLHGGMPRPGEVRVRKPANRKFTILDSNASPIGSVRATQLLYGTMTKTDMAIYMTGKTFRQIQREFGVRPLTLSSTKANENDAIDIISGYWKRGFTCRIERFVHGLEEAGWLFSDSIRYSSPGCETYGGTSGSPITLADQRIVVGVNNTGNESGRKCTMNNPCEIDKTGKKTADRGASYGQQTYWVYSCLDENNELDLDIEGCQLPK